MPDINDLFKNIKNSSDLDIELLKSEVGQYFPFYDVKYNDKTVAFYCTVDESSLEKNFKDLRKSLSEKGYIPILRKEKGEHVIYVREKPKRKEKPVWVNFALLAATIVTTVLTGSILHLGHFDLWSIANTMDVLKIENLFHGAAFFAFPLLSILFVHEMAHYFTSKKHGIATSLPFFIPVPPVLPYFNIGTFGALISSSDPMPDKKALFDVGISGPLAGFIVAVPVTIIGIIVPISEVSSGEIKFHVSLLFEILTRFLMDIPKDYTIELSSIAFAGWVGLLITSINLFPVGQLDGGHIFRAFLGNKQKYVAWIAIVIMIFTGWWFFALIIVFMIGASHPPPLNDEIELDVKRKILFFVAVAVLILCFVPFPIYSSP